MAHADYECCACCDKKLDYSTGAEPKDRLCAECAVDLSRATDQRITTPEALGDWVRQAVDHGLQRTAAEILAATNYRPCPYGNTLDRLIAEHLPMDKVGAGRGNQ